MFEMSIFFRFVTSSSQPPVKKMKHSKLQQIFVLSILGLLSLTNSKRVEITKISTDAEKAVDGFEKVLVKAQVDYKKPIELAINETKLSRNLVKQNQTLKSLVVPLNKLSTILTKLFKAKDFSFSVFQKLNSTGCKRIKTVIANLEEDMDLYVKTKSDSERDFNDLIQQTNNLKLEYFATYIFMNQTQVDNLLQLIAVLEKLTETGKTFSSTLYSTSYEIATVLYDIKVSSFSNCGSTGSFKPTGKYSTRSSRSSCKGHKRSSTISTGTNVTEVAEDFAA